MALDEHAIPRGRLAQIYRETELAAYGDHPSSSLAHLLAFPLLRPELLHSRGHGLPSRRRHRPSLLPGLRGRANTPANTSPNGAKGATLQGFVGQHAEPGATVYTDDHGGYEGMPFTHATVKHSLSEYVKGDIHTNGIESLWSMLKRAHKGTFHKLSPKHLDRYVQEFAGRQNLREADTIEQLAALSTGMDGKRLRYRTLIASNGLSSGARA